MSKIAKLVPLAEYKKPLFNPQGDDKWIIDRLKANVKEMSSKLEHKVAESHMPGLSDEAAKAMQAEILVDSQNLQKLNELLRMQKAQAYEEQLKHAGF